MAEKTTVQEKLSTYEEAFSVLMYEDQLFMSDTHLLDDALTFFEDNQLKHHSLYPQLLKHEFLLAFYANPDAIKQPALVRIVNELGPITLL